MFPFSSGFAQQMNTKYCSSLIVPSKMLRQYLSLCPRKPFALSPAVEIPIMSLFVYAFMASLKRLYCFGDLNACISNYVITTAFYPLLLTVSREFGIYHHPFKRMSVTRGDILFCTFPKRKAQGQSLCSTIPNRF